MYSFENLPPVPLTIEGASVLHQMFRVRWAAWRALPHGGRVEVLAQANPVLAGMEHDGSALFSLLGHKGDLMLIHFRPDFDGLGKVERDLTRLWLWDYLEPTTSYLSVVELGLYESTGKLYASLSERSVVRIRPSGTRRSKRRSRASAPPCVLVCFPKCPATNTCAFIPWTSAAESIRTGISSK